ncbi:hypothetical protein D3C80_768030 [compost metagenome]
MRARLAREFPLPPGLTEIQAGAETEFADTKSISGRRHCLPSLRQAVAGKEDVAAFPPPVGAAIKVIAKFLGIRHIAFVPVECLECRAFALNCLQFGIIVAHEQCG